MEGLLALRHEFFHSRSDSVGHERVGRAGPRLKVMLAH